MTSEDGALVEPVSVAVQVCKVASLHGGQSVLVLGCGPIGVLCQAVAKAYGASKVIGVDLSKSRTEFAKDFAADGVHVVDRARLTPRDGVDPVELSRALGEKIVAEFGVDDGFDVVLECTGAESCIQAGVFATKKGGTYVQVGMGKEVRTSIFATTQAFPFLNLTNTGFSECRVPNNHGLHPRSQHQRLDPVHHRVLPRSRDAHRIRQN